MAKKKLTLREERFIKEMANPETKSQTEAALKAGYSPNAARKIAHENLTKPHIFEAIERRKREAKRYAKVTPEKVLGSAVRNMLVSVDDAFDDEGRFCLQKARETGAIHFVKKITRTPNQFGETVTVEFYSAADAIKEVADYLGMKTMPKENPETIRQNDMKKAFIERAVEAGFEEAKAIEFWETRIEPKQLKSTNEPHLLHSQAAN